MPKMSELELRGLLTAQRWDSMSAITASKFSEERATSFDYYQGDMSKYMPAPDGRSKAVSMDTSDTIEGHDADADGHLRRRRRGCAFRSDRAAGRGRCRAGDRLRQPRIHAGQSGLPDPVCLHQGCAAQQERHRQGLLGKRGAERARRPISTSRPEALAALLS